MDTHQALKLITAPDADAVNLDLLKQHTRITTDVDDTLLRGYLKSTIEWAEKFTGRALINQSWTLILHRFPPDVIRLPKGQLVSVTDIKYFDLAGVLQTLNNPNDSPSPDPDWQQDTSDPDYGSVRPAINKFWPAVQDRKVDAVQIEFIAGFGLKSSDVDPTIRHGIMFRAATLYDSRSVGDFAGASSLGVFGATGLQAAENILLPFVLKRW